MIFAHTIIGIMPVDHGQFSWFWFIGSIIPDIDHLFVLYRHKIFSPRAIINTMRFEDAHGLRYKTKYIHSILGAILFSLFVAIISGKEAGYFFIAYLIHLLLDWPDCDEKEYFYPFKRKIRGFFPILSKTEIIFTVFLLGIYLFYPGF